MSLRDYIYVDEKRLDSYVEQISSPEVSVKVPIWTFSLSLAGPKVTGEQKRISAKRTQPEKIALLLNHLKKHNELAEGRIRSTSYFNHPPVFRIETCSVVKVNVPSLRPRDVGPDSLTLWVSVGSPDDRYRLFLLQDSQKSDDTAFGAHSAYSSLLLIYKEAISRSRKYHENFVSELHIREMKRLQKTLRRPGSVKKFGPISPSERLESEMSSDPEMLYQEVDKRVKRQLEEYFPLLDPLDEEVQTRFAAEPLWVLSEMGAEVGSRQNVETLFRVREVHMEQLQDGGSTAIVTFGYPIFVSAL